MGNEGIADDGTGTANIPDHSQALPAARRRRDDDGSGKVIAGVKRLIMESCCGNESQLGRKWPEARGCEVIRLTEDIDLTSKSGLDFAKKKIDELPNSNILLWSSIPCTGGSTWQYVNEAIWTRKLRSEDPALRQKAREKMRELEGKRSIFRRLFHNFTVLERKVKSRG